MSKFINFKTIDESDVDTLLSELKTHIMDDKVINHCNGWEYEFDENNNLKLELLYTSERAYEIKANNINDKCEVQKDENSLYYTVDLHDCLGAKIFQILDIEIGADLYLNERLIVADTISNMENFPLSESSIVIKMIANEVDNIKNTDGYLLNTDVEEHNHKDPDDICLIAYINGYNGYITDIGNIETIYNYKGAVMSYITRDGKLHIKINNTSDETNFKDITMKFRNINIKFHS